MIHDLLAKVALSALSRRDRLWPVFFCFWWGRGGTCRLLLLFVCLITFFFLSFMQAGIQRSHQIFLVLAHEKLEEVVFAHSSCEFTHLSSVFVALHMIPDHFHISIVKTQFEVHVLNCLSNLVSWKSTRKRCFGNSFRRHIAWSNLEWALTLE